MEWGGNEQISTRVVLRSAQKSKHAIFIEPCNLVKISVTAPGRLITTINSFCAPALLN